MVFVLFFHQIGHCGFFISLSKKIAIIRMKDTINGALFEATFFVHPSAASTSVIGSLYIAFHFPFSKQHVHRRPVKHNLFKARKEPIKRSMPGTTYTVASTAQLLGESDGIVSRYGAEEVAANIAQQPTNPISNKNPLESITASDAGENDSAPLSSPMTEDNKEDRPRQPSNGTDIYFSLVDDAKSSTLALSSPLTTPTQELFHNRLRVVNAASGDFDTDSIASYGSTLSTLSLGQLDRFVKALVEAPMVYRHVLKHLKRSKSKRSKGDEVPASKKIKLAGADLDSPRSAGSTPPPNTPKTPKDLSSASIEASDTGNRNEPSEANPKQHGDLSSIESHATLISDAGIHRRFDAILANQTDVTKAPRARLHGLQLVDASVNHSPAMLFSKDHPEAAIGRCTHVKIPKGAPMNHSIIVAEDKSSSAGAHKQKQVLLRLVLQVVARTTGKKNHLLVADIDVTESFTKAALFEIIRISAQSHNDDILTAKAESLRKAFSTLEKDTCTMQTLTLLSELDRITNQFRSFYLARASAMHDTGHPARLGIPYVSQDMLRMLPEESDAENLRELILGIVGKRCVGGKAWTSRIDWDGQGKRMHCVPLTDGGEAAARVWVCFARDGFDIGHW